MCTPAAAIGAIGVGGAMQGYAANETAKAQARAMEADARNRERAASDALQRGEQDAAVVQMEGSAQLGTATAGLAASGVDVGSGSAARVQEDIAAITAIDKERVRNNAQREAWGLKTEAESLREGAKETRRAGRLALYTGVLGGAANGVATGYSFKSTSPATTPPGK